MVSKPAGDEFATRVLGGLAAALDASVFELDPIYDAVDLELVGAFCAGSGVSREHVVVEFDYHRHTVVIDGTGTVRRVTAKESLGAGPGSDDD
jgi:hypothetical protein